MMMIVASEAVPGRGFHGFHGFRGFHGFHGFHGFGAAQRPAAQRESLGENDNDAATIARGTTSCVC